MKKHLTLPIILSLALVGCGGDLDRSDLSIIGGAAVPHDPTRPSMYPSTIGLVTPTGGCTGVRIGDNTYMTATHCLVKSGMEEETAEVFASNTYSVW